MNEPKSPRHWLKWLTIGFVGFTGLIGLAMSLCGGVFLLQSLGQPLASNYGVGWVAVISLSIGLPVLWAAIRQLRRLRHASAHPALTSVPSAVQRAAVAVGIDFFLSGLWFFLPLLASLVLRRRWSRGAIVAVLVIKQVYLVTTWLSLADRSGLLGIWLAYVLLDALVLVWLFAAAVSGWLSAAGQPPDGDARV